MAKITVDPNMDMELATLEAVATEATAATGQKTGQLVFSVESGGEYRISLAAIGAQFAIGDTIVVGTSVKAAAPEVDNDGIYTVLVTTTDYIDVVEPVVAATSDSSSATVDEYDIFEITPDRKFGKCLIYIVEAGATAGATISLASGEFFCKSPAVTGTLTASTIHFLQVEAGGHLDYGSSTLGVRQARFQLSVFPVAGGALNTHTITVGFIQLK